MLEEYLSQLQQEGQAQALDQSFSLDLAAQARKLSEFQFQNPALWILKLVQAAVASKAPEVRITCTRESLEVRFRPQWDQFIEFGPQAPTWINHLHLGLLAALSLESKALDLSWKSRSLYSRGLVQAAEGGDLRLYVQRRPRPFWHFVDRMRADIAKTLTERCALCPILVRLDYRPVNSLLLEKYPFAIAPVRAASLESASGSYYWLAERSWPARSEQARFALYPPAMRYSWQLELPRAQCPLPPRSLRPISCAHWLDLDLPLEKLPKGSSTEGLLVLAVTRDGAEVQHFTAVRPDPPVLAPVPAPALGFYRDPNAMACARWLGLAALSQLPGRIAYLVDGVIMNPIEAKTAHPGTCAIIADSPVLTDLSQLKVVENETVQADRAWLLQAESELLQRAQPIFLSTSEGEKRMVPVSIREHWRKQLALAGGSRESTK